MSHLQRLVMATLVATGLSTTTVRAIEPDKLLPSATDSVVLVNIRTLLESEIAKKYALEQIKQALDGESLKEIVGELGINPLKDIDQLIIATSGDKREELKVMVIVHGKFNPKKLFAAAENQARKDPDKLSKIEGNDAIMFKYVPDTMPPLFITVIDENTVIAATEQKMVTLAVKASSDKEVPALKKPLGTLIRKIDDRTAVAMTSILSNRLNEVKLPGGNLPIDIAAFQDLLPKMETLSVAIQVRSDVVIEATIGMKDAEAAGDLRSAVDQLLKQLKPLAQLGGAADPRFKPLSDVLTTFRSSSQNTDVTILGKVTGNNIGKMINPDD